MNLSGRKKIYTDEAEITAENVVDVLSQTARVHASNRREIDYLWKYYRGITPVMNKQKEVRENINHKINVNRAQEIVSFKRGYGFGEPIQYIRRGQDESLTDDINALNEHMFHENKASEDSTLAEWLYVCGVGNRMVLPGEEEDVPFNIYTLDPRQSYVVRYKGYGERVVMGVEYVTRNGKKTYSVYTKDQYFEIENEKIVRQEAHMLGDVPIFEYPSGLARLGAFEPVITLLDAINEVESNRLDDVEQFVNSFLALLGGAMDEASYKRLEEWKMLCLPEGVDAKYLSVAMQQTDTQVLVDDLYDAVLTICGIPNRNGGSSTSDTGSAVIMRDGWESAEAQMKSVENEWKKAEKRMLRLVLRILRDTDDTKLSVRDIEIKFSRRNYDNLQTKSQVLTTMLANPKIHPELAFTHCGMFLDPESAYLQSKAWWEEQEQKEAAEMEAYVKSLGDDHGGAVSED